MIDYFFGMDGRILCLLHGYFARKRNIEIILGYMLFTDTNIVLLSFFFQGMVGPMLYPEAFK